MSITEWTTQSHFRFSRAQRAVVRELLLILNRTNFVLKDILLAHVTPMTVGPLSVPSFYVTNLGLEHSESDLRLALKVPLSRVIVCRRPSGRSKGFGFFECLKYDDYEAFAAVDTTVTIGQSVAIICRRRAEFVHSSGCYNT